MKSSYYVYIISNKVHTVFYTGVTNNLTRRIYAHKHKLVEGFSQKYNINKLLYFEEYSDVNEALKREKQIKDFRREKKLQLINSLNKNWEDLWEEISR